jgi:hypothetical protein
MKAKLFLAICFTALSFNVFSQNVYETKQGTVIIYYEYNDSSNSSESKELIAKINYDNTNIKMTLKLNAFEFKHDSLAKILIPNIDNITVTVEGKTNLPNIDTKRHVPQNFIFNGVLKAEKFKKKVSGKGSLTHISDNGFPSSCYLSMQISLKLSDFKNKSIRLSS